MFQSEQAQLQFKSPVALGRLSPVTHARITKSQKEAAEMLKTKEVSMASKKNVLTAKCVYLFLVRLFRELSSRWLPFFAENTKATIALHFMP